MSSLRKLSLEEIGRIAATPFQPSSLRMASDQLLKLCHPALPVPPCLVPMVSTAFKVDELATMRAWELATMRAWLNGKRPSLSQFSVPCHPAMIREKTGYVVIDEVAYFPVRGTGYKARLKAAGFSVSVFWHHARIFPQPDRLTLRIDDAAGCFYCAFISDRRKIGRVIRRIAKQHA